MKQKIYKIIAYVMGALTALLVVLNLALVTARAADNDDISDLSYPLDAAITFECLTAFNGDLNDSRQYSYYGFKVSSSIDVNSLIIVYNTKTIALYSKNGDSLTKVNFEYSYNAKRYNSYYPNGTIDRHGYTTNNSSNWTSTSYDIVYIKSSFPVFRYSGSGIIYNLTSLNDFDFSWTNKPVPQVPEVNVYGHGDGFLGNIPWSDIPLQFITNQTRTSNTQPFGAVPVDSPYFMSLCDSTNRFGIYNVQAENFLPLDTHTIYATWHSHNAGTMYGNILPLNDAHTLSLFTIVNDVYQPVEQFDLIFPASDTGLPRYYQIRVYGNNITLADDFWGTSILKSSFSFVESVDTYSSYGYYPKTAMPGNPLEGIPDIVVPGGTTDSSGNIVIPGGGNVSIGSDDFNISEYLNNSNVKGFITILSGFMAFLPGWLWALLGFSMTAFTVIAVYKFIRG